MIRFLPEWAQITIIVILMFYSLLGGTWIIIQMRFHFQKKKEELSKLKAERKRAEFEVKRAEIELINSGTNLRRGLYDIEKSQMNLVETQAKLGERFGVPAGDICTKIFIGHPANPVKERIDQLLEPLSEEKPTKNKKNALKEVREKYEQKYEQTDSEIQNGNIRVRMKVKLSMISLVIRLLRGRIG
ncbi:hypothetical protein [Alkalihalobacillus sp. TS-13]|uniref:hypothetical protein n=1 Tax=Alkalihalobacillus sp. TS-13 TaxID=2842455 RepID=UPI001C866E86|nr:hypothetical protein [Alkalihalobacillus sp. TS-13]